MGIRPNSAYNLGYLAVLVTITAALFTCHRYGGGEDTLAESYNLPARLEIRLTDAPSQFENIHIHIKAVSISSSKDNEPDWTDFEVKNPGHYDLHQLTNGTDTLLISEVVPPGKISRLRLILGDEHYVVCDSATHSLRACHDLPELLVLEVDETLMSDAVHRLWIDFDGHRSIRSEEGGYVLQPVLRHYSELSGGGIKGNLYPPESEATVWAILGQDSLRTKPDANGHFSISGLPVNENWTVLISPGTEDGFADTLITGIGISPGVYTELNDIEITRHHL